MAYHRTAAEVLQDHKSRMGATLGAEFHHLSEHAAYGRIEAARTARRFLLVMDLLADGSLNVTSVGLLAPHLTTDNHRRVLESARHKSKRDVERIVAALARARRLS